jgi:FMN reductase
MVGKLSIVGVSGSVTRPSRTTALVGEIVERIVARLQGEASLVELAESAPDLFAALTPDQLAGRGRAIVDVIEGADLLVVGTPVYRASMTGAFKHLFDLVDHRRFVGKPVVLAATGGSLLHGLVTEHQLRPLFGFLNALTLPTTVYAVEADFENYHVATAAIHERIDRVAAEAVRQIPRREEHLEVRRVTASA